jgi:hypothetical protein
VKIINNKTFKQMVVKAGTNILKGYPPSVIRIVIMGRRNLLTVTGRRSRDALRHRSRLIPSKAQAFA